MWGAFLYHVAHLRFGSILGNAFDDFVLQPTIVRPQRCILTQSHPDVSHDIITIGLYEHNYRSPTKMSLDLAAKVLPPG